MYKDHVVLQSRNAISYDATNLVRLNGTHGHTNSQTPLMLTGMANERICSVHAARCTLSYQAARARLMQGLGTPQQLQPRVRIAIAPTVSPHTPSLRWETSMHQITRIATGQRR